MSEKNEKFWKNKQILFLTTNIWKVVEKNVVSIVFAW